MCPAPLTAQPAAGGSLPLSSPAVVGTAMWRHAGVEKINEVPVLGLVAFRQHLPSSNGALRNRYGFFMLRRDTYWFRENPAGGIL